MHDASPINAWRTYEDDSYNLFRTTGHYCEKSIIVPGVRASHQIDVVVNLNASRSHRWLVECKHWSRAVGKRDVQAFKSVIDDVGADHGYLLSEKGFQKGALAMARLLNMSLCSLEELRKDFVREQLMPEYQQSREFRAIVTEEEDWGNMDAQAVVDLLPSGDLSVADNIVEIHVFREDEFHYTMPTDACKKLITPEGTLRICLPWNVPTLDCEVIPLKGGGCHLTGNTTSGMSLCGPYRVVFRTFAGPVSIRAYVPLFK